MQSGVIHSDPEILGGTPVFVGTRVPLQALIDYLEGGHPLSEFLDDFPTVTREQAMQLWKRRRSCWLRILLDECLPRALKRDFPPNYRYSLAFVLLRARSNDIVDLQPLMPKALKALENVEPGRLALIE